MHRPKTLADEAMPSGNGVAAFALQRLGHLVGELRYVEAAERALRNAWQAMQEYPHGHVTLLTALEEHLAPTETIIIRGAEGEIGRWRDAADGVSTLSVSLEKSDVDVSQLVLAWMPVT